MSFAAGPNVGLILSSRDRLVRQAQRLVGPSDAEDVVQDAFERALRARTVRSDGDPRPWLARVTRNLAYDTLRSRARRPTVADPLLLEESPEGIVLQHETAAELDRALRTLSPAYRRTIVLHDLQGYTNVEIASLDGVPYQTVRTRLFRARRAMRDRLVARAA
jgi:RNA polymerase sigma-70 factor, ECF subfamily